MLIAVFRFLPSNDRTRSKLFTHLLGVFLKYVLLYYGERLVLDIRWVLLLKMTERHKQNIFFLCPRTRLCNGIRLQSDVTALELNFGLRMGYRGCHPRKINQK